MCLMLYIGCNQDLSLKKERYLTIETLPENEVAVAQWFDTNNVYYVGSHSGCSCGFPHVVAEKPIDYFDGMFDDNEHSEDDLNSIKELLRLVNGLIRQNSPITLYPVWDGDQDLNPKGTISINVSGIDPSHFFFNERFIHIVNAEPGAPPNSKGHANLRIR